MMRQNNPVLGGSAAKIARRKTLRFASIRDERGSSMVEYTIVFALLMTMLLGIADFSRALYAYHYVSSAAREATRYAAVRGSTCSTDTSCTAANSASGTAGPTTQADIQSFVQEAPLGIDGTKVTAAATWPVKANSPAICSTAPTSTNQKSPGCTVQVTVTYPFKFEFPFVSKSTISITSTSQMIIAH